MKWEGNRQSGNVEDRRGQGGGGLGGMLGGRSIGIGTIVLALVGSMIFGVNPLTIINILSGGVGTAPVTQSAPAPAPPSWPVRMPLSVLARRTASALRR